MTDDAARLDRMGEECAKAILRGLERMLKPLIVSRHSPAPQEGKVPDCAVCRGAKSYWIVESGNIREISCVVCSSGARRPVEKKKPEPVPLSKESAEDADIRRRLSSLLWSADKNPRPESMWEDVARFMVENFAAKTTEKP